ncbi:hypothetical protein C0995_015751 [Termitomyces sp. Mi166|nr:hypothetical protein C0995_015751 [Termitomyces sp. Mi166\
MDHITLQQCCNGNLRDYESFLIQDQKVVFRGNTFYDAWPLGDILEADEAMVKEKEQDMPPPPTQRQIIYTKEAEHLVKHYPEVVEIQVTDHQVEEVDLLLENPCKKRAQTATLLIYSEDHHYQVVEAQEDLLTLSMSPQEDHHIEVCLNLAMMETLMMGLIIIEIPIIQLGHHGGISCLHNIVDASPHQVQRKHMSIIGRQCMIVCAHDLSKTIKLYTGSTKFSDLED